MNQSRRSTRPHTLVMLHKQWLRVYASNSTLRSVERCQDWQRKLNGLTIRHLDIPIEVLPLLLQLSLSFLDCTFSIYLFGINIAISLDAVDANVGVIMIHICLVGVAVVYPTAHTKPSSYPPSITWSREHFYYTFLTRSLPSGTLRSLT